MKATLFILSIVTLFLTGCSNTDFRKDMVAKGCIEEKVEELPEQVTCKEGCVRHKKRIHFKCPKGTEYIEY